MTRNARTTHANPFLGNDDQPMAVALTGTLFFSQNNERSFCILRSGLFGSWLKILS